MLFLVSKKYMLLSPETCVRLSVVSRNKFSERGDTITKGSIDLKFIVAVSTVSFNSSDRVSNLKMKTWRSLVQHQTNKYLVFLLLHCTQQD